MIDPARPEVLPAVKKKRRAQDAPGLRTIMVTGDYAATAAAIAEEIGDSATGSRTVSGPKLEAMSDAEYPHRQCGRFSRGCAPHHKMRIVAALRSRGSVVTR